MMFVVFSTLAGLICLLLVEIGASRFHGFPKLPKTMQLVLFVSGFSSLVLMVNTVSRGLVPPSLYEWNIVFASGVFALVAMIGIGFKIMLDSSD